MTRLVACSGVLFLAGIACVSSQALGGEVLVNGSLEASASPANWQLVNSITGAPLVDVNVTEQIGGPASEFEGGLGLYLRPFAGNVGTFADLNLAVNSVLSQTVNAIPTRTYTFSGSARWEGDGDPETNDGYSGGVDFLLPGSPSDPDMTGTVPSPTQTYFQIEFLDVNEQLIGDPIPPLDLKANGQTNDDLWSEHSLSGVAPADARWIRVSAAALDMVDNLDDQDAYFDTFSLRDNMNVAIERLQNADLDAIGAPLGFDVAEERDGADTLIGYRDFANHTLDGQQGLWLRAFAGGDGEIFQIVENATPNAEYEFSAWSLWETGYSGGLDDPSVVTSIDLQFLDAADNIISAESLNLVDAGQSNDGTWRQYTLSGTAPANTDQVRVRAGATGMYNSTINPQSAFFDDFSLIETLPGLTGDYNQNGSLDAADLDLQAIGIQSNDITYDLDNDGDADYDDRLVWVHDLKKTWIGDADLNGQFDSSDLVSTIASGEYEDVVEDNSGWAEGDWDADSDFTSSDLVAALADGGYEQGVRPSVAAVPEPASMLLLLCGSLALRRRNR